MNIININALDFNINANVRIGLVEEKEDALALCGLSAAPAHHVFDHRGITSMFILSEQGQALYNYDYLIITYDIETFTSDINIANAIIAHELGHIENPVPNNDYSNTEASTQAELAADNHAIQLGYREYLIQFITIILTQLTELGADKTQLEQLYVRLANLREVR